MKSSNQRKLFKLICYPCLGATYLTLAIVLLYFVVGWLPPRNIRLEKIIILDPNEKILLMLAAVGAAIAVGKLLAGGEKVTLRLVVGRAIIGAGLSVAATSALAMLPDLSEIALIGIGAALGILGQAFLESMLQRWLGRQDH